MDIQSKGAQCSKETESELKTSGVTFFIQFVGSVDVEKSLNTLTSEQQTEVTREFIRLVVLEAKSKYNAALAEVKQKEDISMYLGAKQVRVHDSDVLMNVSTRNIILIDSFSSRVLNRFLIHDVSLLSLGSEAEMPSFFCFVAKVLEKEGRVRKCFVFKANDRSVLSDVRDAICFTFHLSANNAREGMRTPVPSSTPPTPICTDVCVQSIAFDFSGQQNVFEQRLFSSPTLAIPPEIPPRSKRTLTSNIAGGLSLSRHKEITSGLEKCQWYHGTMTREMAELLVRENGQFLVRKSPNNDEFILVGMNDRERRHVCLLDSEAKHRFRLYEELVFVNALVAKIVTMIGEFRSIVDIIDYFHGKGKPLVLGTVELMLLKPINRLL